MEFVVRLSRIAVQSKTVRLSGMGVRVGGGEKEDLRRQARGGDKVWL